MPKSRNQTTVVSVFVGRSFRCPNLRSTCVKQDLQDGYEKCIEPRSSRYGDPGKFKRAWSVFSFIKPKIVSVSQYGSYSICKP